MRLSSKLPIMLVPVLIFVTSFKSEARRYWGQNEDELKITLDKTHLLPSPYVLPDRELILGTVLGIGLFDVVDLTTNLYSDLQQVFNITAKAALFHNDAFATAVWVEYTNQSVNTSFQNQVGQTVNSSTSFSAITPGAMASYRILPRLAGHIGASVPIQSPSVPKSSLTVRTAFIEGTRAYKEFSYALNQKLALALGGTYDFTYDIWGAGPTVHIGGFQIGAHIYLNVSAGTFFPIIGGSYSTSL